MQNKWIEYWKARTEHDGEYFGKEGNNADQIIELLQVQPKDKILDIGCGPGTFLTDIRKKIKNVECYGIDISDIPIKLSKDKALYMQVADMEYLPYKANSFNKLFSLGVVEHTPRTTKVLKEISRVMQPGGRIFLTVPNLFSMFHITKRAKMIMGTWEIGYERSFSGYEFKYRLEKAGFTQVRWFIIPHRKIHNSFNYIDNKLNKISNRYFGFFLYVTAVKK